MNKAVVLVAPALKGGGAERILTTLASALIARGWQVSFALTLSGDIEYSLSPDIHITVNQGEKSMLGQIRFLRAQLKAQDATFISFFTFQNLYLLAANTGIHRRIIVSERNDPSKTLYRKQHYAEPIRNLLYTKAERIVFQTEDARNYFKPQIARRGVIIGNMLSEHLPKAYHGQRDTRLVAFSRLDRQKNLPMMLRAVQKVFEKHPEYRLELFGIGAEEEKLRTLCAELGITQRVQFMGFCPDVLEQIRTATAFLSSSNYEGISNSMLEALAIGLPCICTDCPCGGARTYITDGENGLLTPVGDEAAMTEAIERIIADPALQERLSERAVKIREKLSVEHIVDQWIAIL